jgi:hypothetical protein
MVFLLDTTYGKGTIQSRGKSSVGQKPQCISHVDDCVVRPRLEIFPGTCHGRYNLKTPLRCKEKRQSPNVSVHVLANLVEVARWIVEEIEGALGAGIITMIRVQASTSFEIQTIREAIQ